MENYILTILIPRINDHDTNTSDIKRIGISLEIINLIGNRETICELLTNKEKIRLRQKLQYSMKSSPSRLMTKTIRKVFVARMDELD